MGLLELGPSMVNPLAAVTEGSEEPPGTVGEHSGARRSEVSGFGEPHRLRVAGLTSRRSNATGGSVSKRLTVDCHFGAVGVEGQHPLHFSGLSRRRLIAPHDAVMDLSVDVEGPI